MWIVGQTSQLFRNCFWVSHGSTCRKRHPICSEGPSSIPTQALDVEEKLVLLIPSNTLLLLGRKTRLGSPISVSLNQRITAQYPLCAQQIGTQGFKNFIPVLSAVLGDYKLKAY